MRIALKVTIEMTPEQVEEYCAVAGVKRSEIREDIAGYVRTALQDAPDFSNGADVTVRAAS